MSDKISAGQRDRILNVLRPYLDTGDSRTAAGFAVKIASILCDDPDALPSERAGSQVIGCKSVDGVHVVIVRPRSQMLPDQLLVLYDHYLAATKPETTLRAALAALAEKDDAFRANIGGCTDGGCVVKRPKGMHTNGGCKCPENKLTARRMMQQAWLMQAELRALLEPPK